MDIIQLYQDYGVSCATEGWKYCGEGWVHVDCPYCTGNPGPHLGYKLDENYYNCWRCGWHSTIPTLAKLIHASEQETKQIVKNYGGYVLKPTKQTNVKINQKRFKLPSNLTPLQANHKRYLESRNFDPEYLEKTWGLLGSGVFSKLDEIDYKHRIVIPFEWDGKIVSFDSRDITGKHLSKYMACPKERETIPHKSILYGKQSAWKETGICVEGPTDVWRLGVNSFAVSGIEYKPKQVSEIAKHFKRVAVCFDVTELSTEEKQKRQFNEKAFNKWVSVSEESQARNQAKKLISDLRFKNVDAFLLEIKGDPGAMEQSEANYLVKQIMK